MWYYMINSVCITGDVTAIEQMWQVSNTDFWVIPGKHDDTRGLIWLSLSHCHY